jgi:hypothetical protein
MVDVISGLTGLQSMAVTSVLNLAPADRRNMISAAIGATLGPSFGTPYADSAVLAAIGAACSRYSE